MKTTKTPEQLSEHFTRAEFACKCGCGFDAISPALVAGLEVLRQHVGKPVTILSGSRCAAHNKAVGGSKKSQHLLGDAADVRVEGISARELFAKAKIVAQFRGFGVDDERQFIHLDVRALTAQWCYHAGREVKWHEVDNA